MNKVQPYISLNLNNNIIYFLNTVYNELLSAYCHKATPNIYINMSLWRELENCTIFKIM